MKIRLLIIVIILYSCKTQKSTLENTMVEPTQMNCVLNNLSKTINYKNKIEKYTSIYKDTIIEFEAFQTDSVKYQTILELNKSERFLWIIANGKINTDSLLIDCVSTTKWVESKFMLDNCEIELIIENFDDNGIAISGGTERVKYKN